MKEEYIVVKVGTSRALADIVAKLMAKYRPAGCTPKDSNDMWGGRFPEPAAIFTSLSPDGGGGYDTERYLRMRFKDDMWLDAATEMGKLIELLEALKEIVVEDVAKREHNSTMYFATISPDGKTVKVGCSTSTFQKVKEVYLKMKSLRQ